MGQLVDSNSRLHIEREQLEDKIEALERKTVTPEIRSSGRFSCYYHACACDRRVTQNDNYCPGCGAKLNWKRK
jgi:hypothetical protein